MNIVFGIIGVVLSLLLIIYRVPVKHFMGEIGWAERYFGPGGTFTALLLIGVFGFILSLMIMTGTLGVLLGGFVDTLFGSAK
ncbi:hypothetical protein JW752_04075 [Candidatus Peregrinibacteria bacterium]|nr:hypothetical protein [Candidatus Peregrinibacteria bacterium]